MNLLTFIDTIEVIKLLNKSQEYLRPHKSSIAYCLLELMGLSKTFRPKQIFRISSIFDHSDLIDH